jgi:hypothetical protein
VRANSEQIYGKNLENIMPRYRNGNVQLGLIHGGGTATFRSRSAKEVLHFHPPVSYLRSPHGIGLLGTKRRGSDGTATAILLPPGDDAGDIRCQRRHTIQGRTLRIPPPGV